MTKTTWTPIHHALPRFLALAIAATLLTTGCAERAAPILEATTSREVRRGGDDPTVVSPDALSTPAAGAREPLVVVSVFSDFQCPGCRRVPPQLERLVTHWPDAVQVQHRHFPLAMHGLAQEAAAASIAAHRQGRFDCFHRRLFGTQLEWARQDDAAFAQTLGAVADACGLERARFDADRSAGDVADRVEQDLQRGRELGISWTPTILVNGKNIGKRLLGRTLIKAVRSELATMQGAIREGIPRTVALAGRVRANMGNVDNAVPWLLRDVSD